MTGEQIVVQTSRKHSRSLTLEGTAIWISVASSQVVIHMRTIMVNEERGILVIYVVLIVLEQGLKALNFGLLGVNGFGCQT